CSLSYSALDTSHNYTLSLHDALPILSGTAANTGNPTVVSAWSTVLMERSSASAPKTKAKPTARPPSNPNRIVFVGRGLTGKFGRDRKSTRLNSSHLGISYAVFCLKKK